jgi:tetratricopeptide (TPR) repeat protein
MRWVRDVYPPTPSTTEATAAPAAAANGNLLARGAAVGRFVVIGLVGKGGMGEVYAAYDPELDRNVAIKLLRAAGEDDSVEGRARLMREAQAIARVSHPNVVVVYDAGTFQDRIFIAMEFVEGSTLGYWMHARTRTWPEVLEVFTAAGRGLAAAHARELVHRDFKPENVMIGADGQVRVMDFGLVQLAGERDRPVADRRSGGGPGRTAAPAQTAAVPEPEIDLMATRPTGLPTSARLVTRGSSGDSFDSGLTRFGASVGTPSYMSPEQFLGEPTDAGTDQFSFCVALYEALYGERPFWGRSFDDLGKNVVAGLVREPPDDTSVPAWIREVLLRGLRVDSTQRWPSMNALLAELERLPAVAFRRRFAAAAAAKLAGVWEAPKGARPTETATKAEMRQAFLATGKAYAAKAFDGASEVLDRFSRRWSELYVEACEATHVRNEQSPEVLDLRIGCLQESMEDLAALCRMFRQATPEVVENAVNAANALTGLDRCEDIELLRAVVRPPDDAVTREAVARLRTQLAEVRALYRVGRLNDALAQAIPLEREARQVDYAPLLADVLVALGTLHAEMGANQAGSATFEEAVWTGMRCRHDEAATEAATFLVIVAGHTPSGFEASEIWSRLAETLLCRMGGHELLRSWLLTHRAALREIQGRLTEALEDARMALALKQKVLGPTHYDVGCSLGNIALIEEGLGNHVEALEDSGRAAKIVEDGLGPDHPRTAIMLSNYGELLARRGHFAEAVEVAGRALAIFDREADPGGPYVTYPLLALGISHLGAGSVEQALPILERANRIRSSKESHPAKRAEVRFPLARALWQSNQDWPRALALANEAHAEYRQSPQTPATAHELAAIERWLAERG